MSHAQIPLFSDADPESADQIFPDMIIVTASGKVESHTGRRPVRTVVSKPTDVSPKEVDVKSPAQFSPGTAMRSYSQRENVQRYLSVRQVADRFSVSVQTVWRWKKESPEFPQPVLLSPGTTRWRMSDLAAFERNLAGEPK